MLKESILFNAQSEKQSDNEAGQAGFGVGVAPSEILDQVGLSPLDGYNDPLSDNYGNYIQDSTGSIMCFVPAFCYRSGYDTAPSKARDGLNALEIADASKAGTDGWILHRAFINAGQQVPGFFIDKYMASKSADGNTAISVKNGDPIRLYTNSSYNPSSTMPNCSGCLYDAIVLGRARGNVTSTYQYGDESVSSRYHCASLFQYAAIAMLSLAHSQACGDGNTEFCAWNDSNPWCKGNNSNLRDYYDSNVTYTASEYSSTSTGLTGSGTPFAKTTHNGQNCGIADINGMLYEVALGVTQPKSSSDNRYGNLLVLKTSADICAIESYASNIDDASLYDEVSYTRNLGSTASYAWPNTNQQFSNESSGDDWALTGCYPRRNSSTTSSQISYLMKGYYYYDGASSNDPEYCPIVGGYYDRSYNAGLFYRYNYSWAFGRSFYGFRISATPLV